MKVTNPTETPIGVQYRGVVYAIDAGDTKEVLDEAAIYWKTNIHNFIVLDATASEPVVVKEETPVVETPTEVTPEITPEPIPEVTEEEVATEAAPDKKSKK